MINSQFSNSSGEPMADELRPVFSWRGDRTVFTLQPSEYERRLQRWLPKRHRRIRHLELLALCLPIGLYPLLLWLLFPSQWNAIAGNAQIRAIALGFIGAILLGISLSNFVAAWMHRYFGHILFLIGCIGGLSLLLFSYFLLRGYA